VKNSTNIVEYYIQNPEQPIRSRKNLKFYASFNERTCCIGWNLDKKSGLSMKLKLDIHLKLSELRVSDSEVPSSVL